MKRNIFITGCAGFIGFHLAQQLVKRGDHVLGFDNFNDYYSIKLKKERTEILEKTGVKVIQGDLCDYPLLSKCMEKQDFIVHLAAQAGVRYSITHPQVYAKSNIEGFLNVLEICKTLKPKKLIFASSSSVYGNNKKVPFSEEDPTDQQASFYGVTKKTNELMAYNYHQLYQIPTIGLRFFTVYGPWGRPDMAYYSFTKDILEGKTIKIFNEGHLKRDFTYIDDIVQGIIAAIDSTISWNIYNLGNNKPVELLHFVECIENALGKKAKKEWLPMQEGDVTVTYADISRSQKDLRFHPKTKIEEGIQYFVDWYKTVCK